MNHLLLAVVLAGTLGCAAARQDSAVQLPERHLEADTVDLRGIWHANALDAKGAAARGLDPSQLQLPRKTRDTRPVYPPAALSSHITGVVTLDCLITADGAPQDCRVISGPSPLRKAATDAVAGWRWEPVRVAGVPRRSAAYLTVRFDLTP